MKKNISKRIGAYIIDMILISAIVSVLFYLLSFIGPVKTNYVKYNKISKEIQEKLKEYQNDKISLEEYNKYLKNNTYRIDKYNVVYISLTLVAIISYYVLFAYYKNGITFGKKICKLQIKSIDGKKASMLQLFIRSLFLYNILTNSFKLALLIFTKDIMYYNILYYYTNIYSVIEMGVLLTIIVNKDNRGLHDLFAKTKVDIIEENVLANGIKEADYKEIKDDKDAGSDL